MAATDLLSMADARSTVNVTLDTHDTELQTMLSGISARIDAICGPVVARAVTDERHDGGVQHLIPRQVPVYSVTSVTEYENGAGTVLAAETLTSQAASAYLLRTHPRFRPPIVRRGSGADSIFPSGTENVVLSYSAGRVADTASVEPKFAAAAAAILRRAWKREQSLWAQRPSQVPMDEVAPPTGFFKVIDPMIREFLADEVLPQNCR
jgi:hypothetical protein